MEAAELGFPACIRSFSATSRLIKLLHTRPLPNNLQTRTREDMLAELGVLTAHSICCLLLDCPKVRSILGKPDIHSSSISILSTGLLEFEHLFSSTCRMLCCRCTMMTAPQSPLDGKIIALHAEGRLVAYKIHGTMQAQPGGSMLRSEVAQALPVCISSCLIPLCTSSFFTGPCKYIPMHAAFQVIAGKPRFSVYVSP